MHDFATLTRRGQLRRLGRLGRTALASWGLEGAGLKLLRHEHNTTFRIDSSGRAYVLRVNRLGVHTRKSIASELAWLAALRRDTDLGVPEPVASPDGSFVVLATDPGVPDPHACVLLRWLEGRFVDARLTSVHMRQIGALAAHLQEHATSWTPPPGFVRPRVGTLTAGARVASMASSAAGAREGAHPTAEDGECALDLVEALVSSSDATLVAAALEIVRATTRKLAESSHGFGLVHGDLHYENFLFHHGEARAIDFDDCGWGFHLYDLAVTLWELEGRPTYEELRDALLESYARERPLPDDHELHLGSLFVLRRLQMLMWILESREHVAFRDEWQGWARAEIDAVGRAVRALA